MKFITPVDGLDKFKARLSISSLKTTDEQGTAVITEDDQPFVTRGDFQVSFGIENLNNLFITGNRSYQREKVATIPFKQGIVLTALNISHLRIPQIHILVRYDDDGNVVSIELMDGQQRVTSLLDFVANKFPLPAGTVVNGKKVGNKFFKDLDVDMQKTIKDYRIDALYYGNLSDEAITEMFVDILNNTTDMKPQEKRNAFLGEYPEWVRDTARLPNMEGTTTRFEFNPLFTRITEISGKKKKTSNTYLKYFANSFQLNNRMEVDQWVSQLAFLAYGKGKKHDWKDGVTQHQHSAWVREVTGPGGAYADKFVDLKFMNNLLSVAKELLMSVPSTNKKMLTPMVTHMMVLYYMELTDRLNPDYSVVKSIFADKFLSIIAEWSEDRGKKSLWIGETTANGNPMPPMKELFGGYNSNAIRTIVGILNKYDKSEFGVTKQGDASFSKKDIERKLAEQGYKDFYTGLPLDIENAEGDHLVAKSMNGPTTYDNLVVCARSVNRMKSNMGAVDFQNWLKELKA